MEEKIRLAVFGQKRLSREGGIEIVVKELCTRMAQNGCDVTCYNRAGHHVSGAEYDKTIEYDGIRQKVVPTIEKKGLAAVSSSFFAALCSAFGRYDVVHADIVEGSVLFVDDNGRTLSRKHHFSSCGDKDYEETLWGQPWGKVIRATVFENLCFPEGFWYEDSIFEYCIYPKIYFLLCLM